MRIYKLTVKLTLARIHINKLKKALEASLDVSAAQNKQLGIIGQYLNGYPIDKLTWDVLTDRIEKSGNLADEILAELNNPKT